MKIIQLPFCFYPDPVGGTEIYVESLAENLRQKGLEIIIVAPGSSNQSYYHNQLLVKRFAISANVNNLRDLYGEGDQIGAVEFRKILDQEKPDLIHLHAFTSGVSLRLVRVAKQRNIPVIFTYHTPTVSCQRGTLLEWGATVCDGKIDLFRCASCTLHSLGLSQNQAKIIGNFPPFFGEIFGNFNLQGGFLTALRMTELVKLRHQSFFDLMSEVDQIIAVCNWVKDVLIINNIDSKKIIVNRQGIGQNQVNLTGKYQSEKIIKIAFLGRLHPTKGVHILIQALRQDPHLPIELDIYGVSQGIEGDHYYQNLINLKGEDSRITFKNPVAGDQVVNLLTNYDLLAVPSQWLETGPLVVLEAFAAGIPVIGSNLGGIAELVRDQIDGLLVQYDSIFDWYKILKRLSETRELLTFLRENIKAPRTMKTVADEMVEIYNLRVTQKPT